MAIQIHTKDGRAKTIEEVFKAYEKLYPEKYRWLKSRLSKLYEVQKSPDGHFRDTKGRNYFIRLRVPTELWLFLQRIIPDFGKDSKDLELLMKVGKNFVSMGRQKTTRAFQVDLDSKGDQDHAQSVGHDDRSGGSRTSTLRATEPQRPRPPA